MIPQFDYIRKSVNAFNLPSIELLNYLKNKSLGKITFAQKKATENIFIKKDNEIKRIVPIRERPTQWEKSPIFFPKNIKIIKDNNGKNNTAKIKRLDESIINP